MDQTFMKTKPVLPLIMAMSVPNMLSMLVNSLYNIIDSLFVARINENAMTALSLVFPIQNISLAIAVGFSIGMNALIAFLLGMKKETDASRASTVGLFLCGVHGLALTVICTAILPKFLRLFSDNEEVIQMGIEYAFIVLLFCAPHHIYIGMEKVFQSVGRMKTCMAIMMSGCIINIILDPMMIFGIGPFPKMGIAGAALATGIGQTIAMSLYVIIYHRTSIGIHFGKKYFVFDKKIIKRLYSTGVPASLTIALPSLLISALNSILASFSQVYIVVLGVYYKLQSFVYMPANGIIQGIRPLIGYNYGAGEISRVKKIYGIALTINMCLMLGGTLICLFIPGTLIGMFSENPETIKAGAAALSIISLGFVPSAISTASCGSLEGLGKGFQSLIISLLRYVLIIIPVAFILSRTSLGANGVWHAFWITEVITALAAYPLYKKVLAKGHREN